MSTEFEDRRRSFTSSSFGVKCLILRLQISKHIRLNLKFECSFISSGVIILSSEGTFSENRDYSPTSPQPEIAKHCYVIVS